MPERAKVEKIKPAFWKREPMKWTTPKVYVIRPEWKYKSFKKPKHIRRRLGERKNKNSRMIQLCMTADSWKTCRKARIYKLLFTMKWGGKINLPACGIYHKIKNC